VKRLRQKWISLSIYDVDPTFSELHDRKTDQRIAREDIRLHPA
jgi:hypothetical protein